MILWAPLLSRVITYESKKIWVRTFYLQMILVSAFGCESGISMITRLTRLRAVDGYASDITR